MSDLASDGGLLSPLTSPSPMRFRPRGSPLAQALEGWRTALAFLAVGLTPVVAYTGNLGFAPMAALLGMGGVVFLFGRREPLLGVGLLALMTIWALASMSWSPATPLHSDFHRYKSLEAVTGLKLAFEFGFYASFVAAMLPLSDRIARRAMTVAGFGMTAMAVLVAIEAFAGAPVYQAIKAAMHQHTRPDLAQRNVARSCYVAMVLFWPVVLSLQRRWRPALVVFVVAIVLATVRFAVDSPILAFLVGGVVFLAVRQFGRPAIWTLAIGSAAAFAFAPLVASVVGHATAPHTAIAVGKASWSVRLDIWRFVAARIQERPLLGWGLDASRSWPLNIPLHPHDAALQIWLELGAVGAALAAVFWAWLFCRIADLYETDRTMAGCAAACAVAYLIVGALSFGVWQEWWLAVGAVAAVFCAFIGKARRVEAAEEAESALLPFG